MDRVFPIQFWFSLPDEFTAHGRNEIRIIGLPGKISDLISKKSSIHFSHIDYGAFSIRSRNLHNHHRCTKKLQMLHNIEDIRTSGYVQILQFSVVQRRVSEFVIYLLGYLRIFNSINSLVLTLCYVLQVSNGNLRFHYSYDKLSVIIEYMMNMAVGYFQFVSKYHTHAICSPANKVSMNF